MFGVCNILLTGVAWIHLDHESVLMFPMEFISYFDRHKQMTLIEQFQVAYWKWLFQSNNDMKWWYFEPI